MSEAIKEYDLPSQRDVRGVRVPLSIVALLNPTVDPLRLESPMNWAPYPVLELVIPRPALGADFAPVVTPRGVKRLLVGVFMAIDTSGVADWYPYFYIDDGVVGHNMWQDYGHCTAAIATPVQIGPYPFRTEIVPIHLPTFPGLEMPAGYTFRGAGITADDRWAESYFFYKEAPA